MYNVFLHGIASKGKIESMKSFANKKMVFSSFFVGFLLVPYSRAKQCFVFHMLYRDTRSEYRALVFWLIMMIIHCLNISLNICHVDYVDFALEIQKYFHFCLVVCFIGRSSSLPMLFSWWYNNVSYRKSSPNTPSNKKTLYGISVKCFFKFSLIHCWWWIDKLEIRELKGVKAVFVMQPIRLTFISLLLLLTSNNTFYLSPNALLHEMITLHTDDWRCWIIKRKIWTKNARCREEEEKKNGKWMKFRIQWPCDCCCC